MIDGIEWPPVGATYHDDTGRILFVKEIRPRDPLGRNVVGLLRELRKVTAGVALNEVLETCYACDLPTFRKIWTRVA